MSFFIKIFIKIWKLLNFLFTAIRLLLSLRLIINLKIFHFKILIFYVYVKN